MITVGAVSVAPAFVFDMFVSLNLDVVGGVDDEGEVLQASAALAGKSDGCDFDVHCVQRLRDLRNASARWAAVA